MLLVKHGSRNYPGDLIAMQGCIAAVFSTETVSRRRVVVGKLVSCRALVLAQSQDKPDGNHTPAILPG